MKTVCVDLDGVLAKYDGWKGVEHIGEPFEGAAEFMRELCQKYHVLVFTTRGNATVNSDYPVYELELSIEMWLEDHRIPYDEVYVGQGKPIAVAYIDDRAVSCRPMDVEPQNIETLYNEALGRVEELANG